MTFSAANPPPSPRHLSEGVPRWRLRDLLRIPAWALALLSSERSFRDNRLLGSPTLNRAGLHRWRVRTAYRLSQRRRERLGRRISVEDRRAFERDGYVLRENLLPEETFRRLRDALLAQAAPAREMWQGDTLTRHIAVDGPLRRAVPELDRLMRDERWQGLTRFVASAAVSPMTYLQAILVGARPGQADPQTRLHADTFHPTMKAWFFLSDVAEDEAPFVYVPGSHRLTAERLDWEHERSLHWADRADNDPYGARGSARVDDAVLRSLNLPAPRSFAVKANTLIVADTFGFHARGPATGSTTRLEVWGYDRRNPFWPWSTDGLLRWLGLGERRIELYWRWRDWAERHGARRNPWRDAGLRHLGDAPTGAA